MYEAPLLNSRRLCRVLRIAGCPGYEKHYNGRTYNLQDYSSLNCIFNYDFFMAMQPARRISFIFRAFCRVFGGNMRFSGAIFLQ